MARFTTKAFRLYVCLLIILSAIPVQASPFFITVFGRTYKVDPRPPPNDAKGQKPQETMQALPGGTLAAPAVGAVAVGATAVPGDLLAPGRFALEYEAAYHRAPGQTLLAKQKELLPVSPPPTP